MEKDCPLSIVDGRAGWMNARNELGAYCSHPKVLDMHPRCGPLANAGTRIVLSGENLGNMVKDVQVRMKPILSSEVAINTIHSYIAYFISLLIIPNNKRTKKWLTN